MNYYFRVIEGYGYAVGGSVDVINADTQQMAEDAVNVAYADTRSLTCHCTGKGSSIREGARVIDAAALNTKHGRLIAACREAGITTKQYLAVFDRVYSLPRIEKRGDNTLVVLDHEGQGYIVYHDMSHIATGG